MKVIPPVFNFTLASSSCYFILLENAEMYIRTAYANNSMHMYSVNSDHERRQ